MPRRIAVEIVGDSASLERAFSRSSRSAKKFQRDIKGISGGVARGAARGFGGGVGLPIFGGGATVAGAVGAGAAIAGIKRSITAAQDLNEQIAKTEVVFGSSGKAVEDWSTTLVDSFALSERQALQTASSFGALFRPLGFASDEAAKQSEKLTQLGADLASFYNTDVQSALDAIQSGIVGESEPLRRYGVQLSEARVQQEALVETGKRHASNLTSLEKTQARLNIIFADSKLAQGDAARSSGRYAEEVKKLQANFDDLAASLGEKLLPAVTKVVTKLNKGLGDGKQAGASGPGGLTKIYRVLAGAAGKVGDGLGFVHDKLNVLGAPIWDLAAIGPQKLIELYDELHQKSQDLGKDFSRGPGGEFPGRFWPADPAAAVAGPRARPKFRATAEQRNTWFDALIGRQLDRVQDLSLPRQLKRLAEIAGEIQAKLADTKDVTRRLALQDKLVQIARQQRDVQSQITDQIKAGNQALKDRADAIKSAVIDRLQARQTDILNKRALADAREQLRIAQLIGGPVGVRLARRGVQDAQFDILRARLEAAPATLAKGGQFTLGNVITINVHGVTDPAKVARAVDEILRRRGRHTSSQSRGPGAGH